MSRPLAKIPYRLLPQAWEWGQAELRKFVATERLIVTLGTGPARKVEWSDVEGPTSWTPCGTLEVE